MGYDMYWKHKPENVQRAYADVRERFEAEVRNRNRLENCLSVDEVAIARGVRNARNFGDPPMEVPENSSAVLRDAIRSQEEVERLSDEMYRAQVYYFRLNIWGMGLCREIMRERGMLDMRDYPTPGFPREEDFDIPEGVLESYFDAEDDERARLLGLHEGLRSFVEAEERARGHEHPEVEGMPIGKFVSNDGWIVTPAQIQSALEAHCCWEDTKGTALPRTDDEEDREVSWWPSWIAFLEGAAENGGFEVW